MAEAEYVHSESLTEHGVVVVFDTYAPNHGKATREIHSLLASLHPALFDIDSPVRSWWFPEARDKVIDRNDNDDMTLVHRDRLRLLVEAYDEGDADTLHNQVELLRNQLTGWAL